MAALTDREARGLRKALCNKSVSTAIITALSVGSTGALTDRQARCLATAMGTSRGMATVKTAFSAGTPAVDDKATRLIKLMTGRSVIGTGIVASMDAIA